MTLLKILIPILLCFTFVGCSDNKKPATGDETVKEHTSQCDDGCSDEDEK